MRSCPSRIAPQYLSTRHDVRHYLLREFWQVGSSALLPLLGELPALKLIMGTDRSDWLIDAPIPCPKCGAEAVAKLALLKARNAIGCRSCGTAIDLTNSGTRAFIEEFSSVMASLLSGSDETAKQH